jgi:hypothetical protein
VAERERLQRGDGHALPVDGVEAAQRVAHQLGVEGLLGAPVCAPQQPHPGHPLAVGRRPEADHVAGGRESHSWEGPDAGPDPVLEERPAGAQRDQPRPGAGEAVAAGRSRSVAAGADGAAFCVGVDGAQHTLFRWNPDRQDWDTLVQHAGPLAQVTAGDASRVWVRDDSNAVHRLSGSQLAHQPLLGSPVHIAAGADGTVWSCDGRQASAFRFISEAGAAPRALTVSAQGPVHRVASTGFEAAHCLGGQGDLHAYDSPYVFKTSQLFDVISPRIEQGVGLLYATVSDDPAHPQQGAQHLVALDAHTGQEVSRRSPDSRTYFLHPVFDPLQEVVYAVLAPLNAAETGSSRLLALDARDLTTVRWAATVPGVVDAAPALRQPRGRPGGPRRRPAKLHADKAYASRGNRQALRRRHIAPRIARPGIDSSERLGRHRRVVERTLAWLHRNRRLLIRYERRADLHQAFLDLGCALICWQLLTHHP